MAVHQKTSSADETREDQDSQRRRKPSKIIVIGLWIFVFLWTLSSAKRFAPKTRHQYFVPFPLRKNQKKIPSLSDGLCRRVSRLKNERVFFHLLSFTPMPSSSPQKSPSGPKNSSSRQQQICKCLSTAKIARPRAERDEAPMQTRGGTWNPNNPKNHATLMFFSEIVGTRNQGKPDCTGSNG